MDYAKLLLSPEGRIGRGTFWSAYIVMIFGWMFLSVAALEMNSMALFFIVFILTIWSGIVLPLKRMHDRGYSGLHLLIALCIPYIGWFWLLYQCLVSGEQGPNAYGPNPKASTLSGFAQTTHEYEATQQQHVAGPSQFAYTPAPLPPPVTPEPVSSSSEQRKKELEEEIRRMEDELDT